MRYSADHKDKARKAILEAGARAIRRHGMNGVGVDGIAAEAGVTSGAFYSNFAGKEKLLGGIIEEYLGEFLMGHSTNETLDRHEQLVVWLRDYLSLDHRANAALGCLMPTLSEDVARASDEVRTSYETRMAQLVAKLSAELEGNEAAVRARAWSIVAIIVGAMTISRALPNGTNAEAVLQSAFDTAVQLTSQS